MATKYVDSAAGSGNGGTTWADAYDLADWITWVGASMAAGDTTYVMGHGSNVYTLTSNLGLTAAGTDDNNIKVIGVKTGTTNEPPVLSDYANGADRPNFNCGAYYFNVGSKYQLKNLNLYGTNTNRVLYANSAASLCYNIAFENTSTGGCVDGGGAGIAFINCYMKSPSDEAYSCSGIASTILFCHIDGSSTGIKIGGSHQKILYTIVSDSTTGINHNGRSNVILQNCTIDDCTTGILENGAGDNTVFLNNIISNCTDGFKSNNSGTVIEDLFFDYNNWYNNTRDMSWDNGSSEDNSAKGLNDTANNPNYTAAGSDDYSLSSGDCIDGGMSITLGIG